MAEGQPQEKARGRDGAGRPVLRVIDVLDHPHGGRILRTRVQNGSAPTVKSLRGATLVATGPRGEERRLEVLGFALTGGIVSDERIRETGRVDLHVREKDDGASVDLTWRLIPD